MASHDVAIIIRQTLGGGAPGKIDLYVGKEVVRRGIPFDGACDELIQLIKDHGRWVEKEEEEVEEAVPV
jgi:(E)-4-hydroxy-3-methylbut-2-enyl-diphosphate synthase